MTSRLSAKRLVARFHEFRCNFYINVIDTTIGNETFPYIAASRIDSVPEFLRSHLHRVRKNLLTLRPTYATRLHRAQHFVRCLEVVVGGLEAGSAERRAIAAYRSTTKNLLNRNGGGRVHAGEWECWVGRRKFTRLLALAHYLEVDFQRLERALRILGLPLSEAVVYAQYPHRTRLERIAELR